MRFLKVLDVEGLIFQRMNEKSSYYDYITNYKGWLVKIERPL